jgi:CheY-like chemotaxis protein
LLNDILDVSKIEAGQMTLHEELFDLPHALKACLKLIYPAAAQKGLELNLDIAPDMPRKVLGDGLRLRQVVLNLLGNAAKFTSQGSITLRVARIGREGSLFRIDVEDTGIGVPSDRQAAIFEEFVQADTGVTPRYGGTGLGLSISIQLAQLMGGELRLDSEVGRGSRFYLTLPLRVADSDVHLHDGNGETAAAPDSFARDERTSRLLVAEDHDVNQLLMTAMLTQLGYRFDLADNGVEAVRCVAEAAAQNDPYTLVLMDIQMPEMDGIEATREIRRAGTTGAALPIIALTANAYAEDIAACLAAGMQAHLAKPLRLEDLTAAVRRWNVVPGPLPAAVTPDPKRSPVQERYRLRKAEALDRLAEVVRAGVFSDAELADVSGLLHKLAGTAGMFGEAVLGEGASELESGIAEWPVEERAQRVRIGYEALLRAA